MRIIDVFGNCKKTNCGHVQHILILKQQSHDKGHNDETNPPMLSKCPSFVLHQFSYLTILNHGFHPNKLNIHKFSSQLLILQ